MIKNKLLFFLLLLCSSASFGQVSTTAMKDTVNRLYQTQLRYPRPRIQEQAQALRSIIDWTGTLGLGGGGTLTGTGTVNYVPRWTGESSLAIGLIYDNGSFVGVGSQTNAGFYFDVFGTSRFKGNSIVEGSSSTTGEALTVRKQDNTNILRVGNNGKVVIGSPTGGTEGNLLIQESFSVYSTSTNSYINLQTSSTSPNFVGVVMRAGAGATQWRFGMGAGNRFVLENYSGSTWTTSYANHNTTANMTIGGLTDDAVNKLQVIGNVKANQYRLTALNTAPASATDTGTLGEIRITNGFLYVCVATNTWVRAQLNSW